MIPFGKLPRRTTQRALIAGIAATALALAGCQSAGQPRAIATFQVQGEQFRIELTDPQLIEHAEQLLAGEEVAPIPVGLIVRDSPSINEPWSWHIDPDSVEFADFTTEVCDGLPSFVEDETLTSDRYCPWGAQILSVQATP